MAPHTEVGAGAKGEMPVRLPGDIEDFEVNSRVSIRCARDQKVHDLAADWSDAINPNGARSYHREPNTPITPSIADWNVGSEIFGSPQPAWAAAAWGPSSGQSRTTCEKRSLRSHGSRRSRIELPGVRGVGTLLYFSMVTMTTLGYGDIVPASPVAHSLRCRVGGRTALCGNLHCSARRASRR